MPLQRDRTPTRFKVITGGQTGVDRAGLDAAQEAGIPVGGWCPKGRRAMDGVIPNRYPLMETESRDYAVRTEWNVRDADATLILCVGGLSGGTRLTADFARQYGKPLLIVDLLQQPHDHKAVRAWLSRHSVRVLNIAGPREENCPGSYSLARRFLSALFFGWDSMARQSERVH